MEQFANARYAKSETVHLRLYFLVSTFDFKHINDKKMADVLKDLCKKS